MGQQVQTVKMPDDMRQQLRTQAAREGRTVSEIIKDAVTRYLTAAQPAQ